MTINFISGFLGSGKTSSIIAASRLLMNQGLKTGVVTNDQGKYLVDNYFINESGIPSVEVANGCFCCNYDDFDSHILDMAENGKPDIIFAESVGSCADIIATVMKPLSDFRSTYSIRSSLSAFTDGRLLQARLDGGTLPFSEDVIYIFDKQIEEADILVINKSDLFDDKSGKQLLSRAKEAFPGKRVLFQSSFNDSEIETWHVLAQEIASTIHEKPSMEMDYEKYASGELRMAWFDKVFSLESSGDDLAGAVRRLGESINNELKKRQLSVGHLKLFIKTADYPPLKLSLTGMDDAIPQQTPDQLGTRARIVLNARVETEPETLSSLVNEAVSRLCENEGIRVNAIEENSFRPGIPRPVHRFA